ncbi:hypothetical protein [Vibrio parahaemolyticus]|uniref:hypothetical protein n=1 Tax=Vibrio parahaemolyticus TaxID=670 RepID=UPI001131520C|nr:hypothetical protein [Vibrio parahaemolyticus]
MKLKDKKKYAMQAMLLKDYIEKYYGSYSGAIATFAEAMGVAKQQVNKWLTGGWLVVIASNNQPRMVSPKHILPETPVAKNIFISEIKYPMYDEKNSSDPVYLSLCKVTGEIDVVREKNDENIQKFFFTVDSRLFEYNSVIKQIVPKLQRLLAINSALTYTTKDSSIPDLTARMELILFDIQHDLYMCNSFDDEQF